MTTTPHPIRHTEPICPPWCGGHDNQDHYQGWEKLTSGQGSIREHCGVDISTAGAHAFVNQTELDDHTLAPSAIDVYVDNDTATLTPGEARAFAKALLMLADDAEARG